MDGNTVLQVAKEALYVAALVSAPVLLAALALGLVVGMFQAATQIQEMTLSFIPKLIAMGLAIMLAGPWMLGLLVDFTERLFHSIPGMLG